MSMCDCNQGRLPCNGQCKPIEVVKFHASEISPAELCVRGSDFDRVTAERDALQECLNTVDQQVDDLREVIVMKDREHLEAQRVVSHVSSERDTLRAQLAERDALLSDLNTIRPGQPGCGDFSREQRTWADLAKHVSASAEPSDYLKSCEAAHRALSLEPSAPVERDLDDDPFFVQQAEPVERDERAEFESYYADLSGLPAEEIKSWRNGVGYLNTYERCGISWDAWMARAALDKSTEGASHE